MQPATLQERNELRLLRFSKAAKEMQKHDGAAGPRSQKKVVDILRTMADLVEALEFEKGKPYAEDRKDGKGVEAVTKTS